MPGSCRPIVNRTIARRENSLLKSFRSQSSRRSRGREKARQIAGPSLDFKLQLSLKVFRRSHRPSRRYTLLPEYRARGLSRASRSGSACCTWGSQSTWSCPLPSCDHLFLQFWPSGGCFSFVCVSALTRNRTARGFDCAVVCLPQDRNGIALQEAGLAGSSLHEPETFAPGEAL
jgi:hypothetical protein